MLHIMSSGNNLLVNEVAIMSHYLIGQPPNDQVIHLYTQNFAQVSKDRTVCFALKHPLTLRALDAYAALKRPNGELRKRLFTLSTILEVQPEFASYFLPQKRSPFFILWLAWRGLGASLSVFSGFILEKLWLR